MVHTKCLLQLIFRTVPSIGLNLVIITAPHATIANTLTLQYNTFDTDDLTVHDDKRLSTKVSLEEKSTTLIKLFQKISEMTNVSLSISKMDGAGDDLVAVYCHDTSLYKIMNGLTAVMSYKPASWEWRSVIVNKVRKFTLVETKSAKHFRESVKREAQEKLEREAQLLVNTVDGTDEEKLAAINEVFGHNGSDFERRETLSMDRIWSDVRNFRDLLSPDQRSEVLRGDASYSFPFDKVSPQTQGLYQKENLDFQNETGLKYTPGRIVFRSSDIYPPSASVVVGNSTSGMPIFGGGAYRARQFYAKMKNLWLRNSDQDSDNLELHLMKKSDESYDSNSSNQTGQVTVAPSTDKRPVRVDFVAKSAFEIGKAVDYPFIARLPLDSGNVPIGTVENITMKEFHSKNIIREKMCKWHDGVLMFTNTVHLLDDRPFPSLLTEQLKMDVKPGDFIPLPTLFQICDLLTSKQLLRLKTDLPMASSLSTARGIFQFCYRNPEMFNQMIKGKLEVSDGVIEKIKHGLPAQFVKLMYEGVIRTISCNTNTSFSNGEGHRRFVVAFHSSDGRLIADVKYLDTTMPKPEKTLETPRSIPTH